jgi:hypothetical protein
MLRDLQQQTATTRDKDRDMCFSSRDYCYMESDAVPVPMNGHLPDAEADSAGVGERVVCSCSCS